MRLTALARNQYGSRPAMSAANVAEGVSLPPPVGGWDALSPISNMPPQNAVDLINWFPQPGYAELRRGFVEFSDTGTGTPVESIMPYQGQDPTTQTLIVGSGGSLFDAQSDPAISIGAGFMSNRWQFVNFTTTGGSYLWMCNGSDTPQYWDGATLTATVITVVTPADIIDAVVYRSRIWMVLKNSTDAAYLPLDSIQGAATVFPLGSFFREGGYLNSIGTWSTDTNDGPNEYIVFISQFGDCAVFRIDDPTDPTAVFYQGTSSVSTPIGQRCLTRIGADLAIITIEGVLPLSQILSYDKAQLIGASLTKNIRAAMTQAARDYFDNFGWQLVSYPRNTMAILNVPVGEGSSQQQFVMNTITGAWCQFEGQYANAWGVFQDRAYFGGNDGIVRLADEAGGDENQTLSADMRCAFNYYKSRGQLKRWTMLRPSITVDASFPTEPALAINVDFGDGGELAPIEFGDGTALPLWDSAIWDAAIWPGTLNENNWFSVSGLGYCASIRMTCDIQWSESVRNPAALKVNGFDVLYDLGAFI